MNNIHDHIARANARMNFMELSHDGPGVCCGPHTRAQCHASSFRVGKEGTGQSNPTQCWQALIQLDVEADFSVYRKKETLHLLQPNLDECWLAGGLPANACTQLFFASSKELTHMPEQHLSREGGWKQGFK